MLEPFLEAMSVESVSLFLRLRELLQTSGLLRKGLRRMRLRKQTPRLPRELSTVDLDRDGEYAL